MRYSRDILRCGPFLPGLPGRGGPAPILHARGLSGSVEVGDKTADLGLWHPVVLSGQAVRFTPRLNDGDSRKDGVDMAGVGRGAGKHEESGLASVDRRDGPRREAGIAARGLPFPPDRLCRMTRRRERQALAPSLKPPYRASELPNMCNSGWARASPARSPSPVRETPLRVFSQPRVDVSRLPSAGTPRRRPRACEAGSGASPYSAGYGG